MSKKSNETKFNAGVALKSGNLITTKTSSVIPFKSSAL